MLALNAGRHPTSEGKQSMKAAFEIKKAIAK
jgi:hypothetical protein